MTPGYEYPKAAYSPMDNLDRACQIADKCGVTTALITGKGDPSLHPDRITLVLTTMNQYFPLIELQTNGLSFHQNPDYWAKTLMGWRAWGLTTIAVSCVHYLDGRNAKIYTPGEKYPSLKKLIKFLRELKLTVRLNCVGLHGYIATPAGIRRMAQFAYDNGAKQLTWRSVAVPKNPQNPTVARQARELQIRTTKLVDWVKANGDYLYTLPHGGMIFNIPVKKADGGVGGQNLCMTNCLTKPTEVVRQLIYVEATDELLYDWEYEGAVILG